LNSIEETGPSVTTAYIHNLPGRLRVRCGCGCLRRHEPKRIAIQQHLASVAGVTSVAVSPHTGSVTVRYDTRQTTAAALFELLKSHGCFDFDAPLAGVPLAKAPVVMPRRVKRDAPAPRIARAVTGFLVEKAIERSLMALVAAVI
jgi:copper chaperone CopZ